MIRLGYYPEWPDANKWFNIANCFQNVIHDSSHRWTYSYCVTIAIEWFNYLVLTALLSFLLVLHCVIYKRVNRGCSCRVFKRHRVQILSLSVLMTSILFIKLTLLFNLYSLVLLLVSQFLRFLIWSLTLRNFIRSGMDLMSKPKSKKIMLRILNWSTVSGALFFVGYSISLICQQKINDVDVLSCKSPEFVIQSSLLISICLMFLFMACKTSAQIQSQIQTTKDDATFTAINESRRQAMRNVWFLLIWFLIAAFESFLFSLYVLVFSEPWCYGWKSPPQLRDCIKFVDRTVNLQSWFIPLIWLYWPTKARKKEYRSRRQAID